MMRGYLKELRGKQNMSQSDMANLLGISRQYYSFIENNDRQHDMSLSLLQKISSALGVTLAELIENEKNFNQSCSVRSEHGGTAEQHSNG